MTNYISSMKPRTRVIIRNHIIGSEKRIPYPYLDSKGHLTIGIGFKVNNKADFAKLPLSIKKNGTWVSSSDQEKNNAYDKMMIEKKSLNGDFNWKVERYSEKSNIRMLRPAQDAKLDAIIAKSIAKLKNDVGANAWSKLNDRQKAAVADIAYNTGGLNEFPKLKQEIRKGNGPNKVDPLILARESTYYTSREKGTRNIERLQRNFEALSGLDRAASDKRLQEVLDKEATRRREKEGPKSQIEPTGADNPNTPPSSDAATGAHLDSLDEGGAQQDSQKVENADPGDSSGANNPDTPAPQSFTPQQQDLKTALLQDDGPVADILAKDPSDWTESEFRLAKKETSRLQPGPDRTALDEMATAFLADKYGDGPVQLDATGRMIEPLPIKPINAFPVDAIAPGGGSLQGELTRIADAVAGIAGVEGTGPAAAVLQTGLNMIAPGARGDKTRSPRLKIDGVIGPRTRRALRGAAGWLGAPKVEEGLALGRFAKFAHDARVGRHSGTVGSAVQDTFGPLFRSPGKPRPDTGAEEDTAFQATITDLGEAAFGRTKFTPLREDGDLGPKTETAFRSVLPEVGAERFTTRLGQNLGFLDLAGRNAFI